MEIATSAGASELVLKGDSGNKSGTPRAAPMVASIDTSICIFSDAATSALPASKLLRALI